ncbi:MAG: glycosyltransferase family 2 protein [Kofleriaceae bacterium]
MPTPFLSIVSITFQNAAGLALTLESIARQTFTDFEVIVVDGGSKDGTRAVVESNDALVTRFISEPDRGISDAFNKGTAVARGTLVNYLNAGDRYLDASVLATVHAAHRARPFAWAYGLSKRTDADGNVSPSHAQQRLPYSFDALAAGRLLVSHQAAFFDTAAVREIGAYDEALVQAMDYDLFLRMAQRYEPAVIDEPLVLYDTEGVSARRNLEGLLAKHAVRARVLGLSTIDARIDLGRTYARYAIGRVRRLGKRTLVQNAAGRALLRRLGLLE